MLYKEKTTNKKKPHSFEYNVCISVQRMNGRMEKKAQAEIGLDGNIKQKNAIIHTTLTCLACLSDVCVCMPIAAAAVSAAVAKNTLRCLRICIPTYFDSVNWMIIPRRKLCVGISYHIVCFNTCHFCHSCRIVWKKNNYLIASPFW